MIDWRIVLYFPIFLYGQSSAATLQQAAHIRKPTISGIINLLVEVMLMNDEHPLHPELGRTKKVIQPLPGQTGDQEPNPAVELIRSKIDALYDTEQEQATTPTASTSVPPIQPSKSKHQRYMDELSNSGKSLEEIQAAWHQYYVDLPDHEKREVWQEFYAEHTRQDEEVKKAQVHPQQQATPAQEKLSPMQPSAPQDSRSVSEIKSQIISKARAQAKPKNPHLQSLLFGLSMGTVVVAIMLFSFFNERIIAPFITPSRVVSSTPIITDPNSTAVGKDPKIIIPKINVEIPVVYDEPSIQEEAVQKALERGVLHYATTPKPGEKGNAVIFGHSSNNILNSGKYKFAFVLLSRLEDGDTFMLEKGGKRYVYRVFRKEVVAPTDLSVLDSHGDKSTVTLITCDPPGTSINRLIVVGEQISPSPSSNVASSVKKDVATRTPAQLPSNSPSLWSRMTNWF